MKMREGISTKRNTYITIHKHPTQHSLPWRIVPPAPCIPGKMRVITVYDDEREIIVTYVSTSGLQKQSNKAEKGQMNNSQITETSY